MGMNDIRFHLPVGGGEVEGGRVGRGRVGRGGVEGGGVEGGGLGGGGPGGRWPFATRRRERKTTVEALHFSIFSSGSTEQMAVSSFHTSLWGCYFRAHRQRLYCARVREVGLKMPTHTYSHLHTHTRTTFTTIMRIQSQ